MQLLKRATTVLCRQLVALAPDQFLAALVRHHPDLIVTKGARNRSSFRWNNSEFKQALAQFEDLAFLFWTTPLNRGLLRQDFDEAATLFKTVRLLTNPCGVEIGRFHGASTVLLAAAVGPAGKLISIDLAPQDDGELLRVLRRAGVGDRVELIVGDANQVQRNAELDFVFIDGDHSYDGARRDHNKWGKLVRVGGFIIHHDMANQREFATQWTELKRLREDILQKQEQSLELFQEVGSMSVFKRRSTSWGDI